MLPRTGSPEQVQKPKIGQAAVAGFLAAAVGALVVTVLGTVTIALMARTGWVLHWLYPGQHLSAAVAHNNEVAASVRADGYGLILLAFPVIGFVMGMAAGAAWVAWLSWQTSPAADAQTVTDRVRVLVGVAALVVLPWVGRRRGWFGPVGSSLTARLGRVAGCAAVCGLGVAVVRMDSHLGVGPHGPGPFSMLREIIALVLIGATLTAPAVVKARWPDAEPSAVWFAAGIAGLLVFFAVPLQALTVVYVAGILAATARRSPVTTASLAAGTVTGLATGLATSLAVYEVARTSDRYVDILFLGMITMLFLLAGLAGAAAAWLLPGTGSPEEVRVARGLQGMLAGAVAGAVCGLLLTNLFVAAVVVMIFGPLIGAGGGAVGGFAAADHPLKSRPARSWAIGLFVRF